MDQIIVAHDVGGPVLQCAEGLSFWGGVNAATGVVQDAHHPQAGATLAGAIVMMPTSRGSCSGSGVLLELALNGHAPAALVFHEPEDILTLGAFIAGRMFDRPVAVLRLSRESYDRLAEHPSATIQGNSIIAGDMTLALTPLDASALCMSDADKAMLAGDKGEAVKLAMEAIFTMGVVQGAARLTDITRAHIDGCIYAGRANLVFAEKIRDMGARVTVPTTMNAISVDQDNWQSQGVPPIFGEPASRLASAYVTMGASPTFTCAPYLADDRPREGEDIGWSESNAVIYANSVLGARSVKHPDFFDLFVAMTGRAPMSGVYLAKNRQAQLRIHIDLPEHYSEAIWPLIGWVVGQAAPDRIPVIEGLEDAEIGADDLKALCAAFGTTSAMPILHIRGVTPEGNRPAREGAEHRTLTPEALGRAWAQLNSGPTQIDLVALGSPHFSLDETRRLTELMRGRRCAPATAMIVTLSRETYAQATIEGLLPVLEAAGVQIVKDLCWCSISEPVFPPNARNLMTNSGKYAHYAPGLSGRTVRFGSLEDCAKAAESGHMSKEVPTWLM
ncbi:aconitase X [Phaeobacter sp. J2-8]|uniref:cis-3-hydroxy-L-proline dehydratase n=1 Tax=Phaeobacter sp. J2-8 TaxID=2931394 RepID=UPI001FD59B52|nr:aconitase X [Phaeobacter sp. J2-8]MCJ7873553.1 aconitase X [Phaeobacter sp. J2-8]